MVSLTGYLFVLPEREKYSCLMYFKHAAKKPYGLIVCTGLAFQCCRLRNKKQTT